MSSPKSVVFDTPPPQFAFKGVFFETAVKLVDQHKAIVKGWSTELVVTLRFHDTYDVVGDQSLLQVDRSAMAIDASSGVCQLRVLINKLSASCEGRTFCLEVRSVDGDLECAFSSPIFVVKEKLSIVQQPPDVWFKDEGGREKCMVITAVLEAAPGAMLEDRVVPLQLQLLYESGTAVLNQSILRLFPDMRPNMTRGRISISFRIDDVSKNHQGQSFMLELAPEKQTNSQMFQDIAPVRTSVIAIRSKRNKRKLNGTPRSNLSALSATPRGDMVVGVMPSPTMADGPPPNRRPRHLPMVATVTTPVNNPYMMAPQSAPSRMGHMMMPAASVATWSSHIQAPPQSVPAPTMAPRAVPTPTMAAQWRLSGFEIQQDGTPNVSRPIYRCAHCRRLADVDMVSQGNAVHEPQCMFAGTARFSAQVPTPTASTPQQPQQLYMNTTPRAAYPASPVVLHTTNGMNVSAGVAIAPLSSAPVREASPKVMPGPSMTTAQRPGLTISPFMNKVVASDGMSDQQSSVPSSSGISTSGNLFASTAFRTQMGLSDSLEQPSPTTEDKFAFLAKPLSDKSASDPAELSLDPLQSTRTSDASSALNAVREALQDELTSMGISIDSSLTKSSSVNMVDTGTPLPDFSDFSGELGEEEHVFYILARMYTNMHGRKVGLPAFDQFQRMVGFYKESQSDVQTQVLFHSLAEVGLTEEEKMEITNSFAQALEQDSDAVHSLPKYQHNVVLLREDALMYHWSRSIQMLS